MGVTQTLTLHLEVYSSIMREFGAEMTREAVTEFLVDHGHGVLSFGGDDPYGLPISFGYDLTKHRCIFQLIFDTESRKEIAIDKSEAVSLISYERNSITDWTSVIINGELTPIEDGTPAAVEAAEIFAKYASVVDLTVFDKPLEELTPTWYELSITEMTGRHSEKPPNP